MSGDGQDGDRPSVEDDRGAENERAGSGSSAGIGDGHVSVAGVDRADAITARAFRDAFGAFATGVAVVTAAGQDGPVGLTTNAVASVSLEPPLFLVCFATSSRTLEVVREAGELGVSVLRSSQEPMARAFATKAEADEKFHGIALDEIAGVPVIAGAAAVVTGRIDELIRAGDHDIVICRTTGAVHDPAAEPLLFHRGQFAEMAPPA